MQSNMSGDGPIARLHSDRVTHSALPAMVLERGETGFGPLRVINLRESISRHKVMFFAGLMGLSMIGGTIVLRMQPVYTASTIVLFDPRTRQVVKSSPVIGQFNSDNQTLQTVVETELQRITSLRVIDPVVAKFGLLADPEFVQSRTKRLATWIQQWSPLPTAWTQTLVNLIRGDGTREPNDSPEEVRQAVISQVFHRLKVQVVGHSTAMQISFWSEDAKKAAVLVNAFANEYAQLSVKDSSSATEQALASLDKRSNDLRDLAVNAESAVEKFRSEAHLVEGTGGSLTSMQITQLTSQLVQAEADLAIAEARTQQIESVGANLGAAPDVLASPVIQNLREQAARAAAALAEAQSRSGNLYPTTVARRVELMSLESQIAQEIANVVRSLTAARYGAKARVEILNAKLTQTWRQAEKNSAAEVHLHQLMLEASVRHSLYEEFLRRIQEITQQLGTAQPDAQVLSPAEPPLQPSWPNIKLLLPGVVIAAGIAATLCAVFADLFSRTFKSLQHVVQIFGERPTVLIPRLPAQRRGLLSRGRDVPAGSANHFGAYSEAINSLRVQLRRAEPKHRTVLFSSAVEAEGKTETAVAFARQEAQAGFKVLMIDADLRRPSLHRVFGGKCTGLAELLSGRQAFEDVVQYDSLSGLAYLAAGKLRSSAVDLLLDARMQRLMTESDFDRIIIDSPAVLAVADARIITSLADQTVYIVRWDRTPRRLALLGLQMLQQSGGSIIGPVFVQVDSLAEAHGGAHYVRNYRSVLQSEM